MPLSVQKQTIVMTPLSKHFHGTIEVTVTGIETVSAW